MFASASVAYPSSAHTLGAVSRQPQLSHTGLGASTLPSSTSFAVAPSRASFASQPSFALAGGSLSSAPSFAASRPSNQSFASNVPSNQSFASSVSFSCGSMQAPQLYVRGMRVEVECKPGTWQAGCIDQVASDGKVTVRYDDGAAHSNIPPNRVRSAANPFEFKFKPSSTNSTESGASLGSASNCSTPNAHSFRDPGAPPSPPKGVQKPAQVDPKQRSSHAGGSRAGRPSPRKDMPAPPPPAPGRGGRGAPAVEGAQQPPRSASPAPHWVGGQGSAAAAAASAPDRRARSPALAVAAPKSPAPQFAAPAGGAPSAGAAAAPVVVVANGGSSSRPLSPLSPAPVLSGPAARLQDRPTWETRDARLRGTPGGQEPSPAKGAKAAAGLKQLAQGGGSREVSPRPEDQQFWEEGGEADACRKRLAEGIEQRDADVLRKALAEAQQLGVHCSEARQARDALLTIESSDFGRRASMVVDEAIEADDWWKYQAAMQVVIGGLGQDHEQASRLKAAMKLQQERHVAFREMKKAMADEDPERLRNAIEKAKACNAKDAELKQARAELRGMTPKFLGCA